MTDEELIARLRKFGELWPDDHAAADRIEALKTAIRDLQHRWYLGDLQEKDFTAALEEK